MFFVISFHKHVRSGISNEGASPKMHLSFIPHAVDGGDVDAVGCGVTHLGRSPHVVPVFRDCCVHWGDRRRGSDGGGVEDDLGAGEGCKARGFRKPLIVADENRDRAVGCCKDADAGLAGREVILLVECGIVRDVSLTVGADRFSIRSKNAGGVVVLAVTGLFKDRSADENDLVFFTQLREALGCRAGDGFRETGEGAGVTRNLAEVGGAEELGEARRFLRLSLRPRRSSFRLSSGSPLGFLPSPSERGRQSRDVFPCSNCDAS